VLGESRAGETLKDLEVACGDSTQFRASGYSM